MKRLLITTFLILALAGIVFADVGVVTGDSVQPFDFTALIISLLFS